MLIEPKTTACKLKAIYFNEVDRFQLTQSTLANFKFQYLAKVKIDQVNKRSKHFLSLLVKTQRLGVVEIEGVQMCNCICR